MIINIETVIIDNIQKKPIYKGEELVSCDVLLVNSNISLVNSNISGLLRNYGNITGNNVLYYFTISKTKIVKLSVPYQSNIEAVLLELFKEYKHFKNIISECKLIKDTEYRIEYVYEDWKRL